ncbi:MAG: hypothetical protein AAF503_01945, partial [Pseudomonadota bacterium]
MPLARYLTHPQVIVDPDVPVPDWHLNPVGAARVRAVAASGGLAGTVRVFSSAECIMMQLCPATNVSAWVSSSHLPLYTA